MKQPTLRRKPNGYFFCRWGGTDHYFGTKSERVATSRYRESMVAWAEWWASKAERRDAIIQPGKIPTVNELVEQFLDNRMIEVGGPARVYYAKALAPFILVYQRLRADTIRVGHLQKLKEGLMRHGWKDRRGEWHPYKPKSICHILSAVRIMYRWAVGLEIVPPVSFDGCRNPPLGPPPIKSMNIKAVNRMVRMAPDRLKPWLAINYLALLRPSEVIRCVHGQGQWLERGVFVLDRGKMDLRASSKRHCVFSTAALKWLHRCDTIWTRLDSYWLAARRAQLAAPSLLRHSSAQHLATSGVPHQDIEQLLGHAPSRLALTYHQPAWQRLRRTAGRLATRFDVE